METLTQKRLKELFTYNPGTGYLIRKIGVRGKRSKAGDRAGCVQKSTGYRLIRIDGKNYREHRLIFLYMTGEFPAEQVDHINRVRDDNRWINLRVVTQRENLQNRSDTRYRPGVSWHKQCGKYRADIWDHGKKKFLGLFSSLDEAIAAREMAECEFKGVN